MAVKVENRIALARLFLSTLRFTFVTPILSAKAVTVMPRRTNKSSRWQTTRCGSSTGISDQPVHVGAQFGAAGERLG